MFRIQLDRIVVECKKKSERKQEKKRKKIYPQGTLVRVFERVSPGTLMGLSSTIEHITLEFYGILSNDTLYG